MGGKLHVCLPTFNDPRGGSRKICPASRELWYSVTARPPKFRLGFDINKFRSGFGRDGITGVSASFNVKLDGLADVA